ncbi:FxLD family lantipeptide [Streptomyces sp. SID5785]|uniref:FxLD family lanthipeptide n=1 Tax=Streptomyces sp. SID5785 TaxID=2690309 RepID=UPI0013616B4F|nr:FxLD family lanthipeptide [Streptomyces sp. SID5785]MZD05851.1 FxLD family lantipeptide [Streptomyces sp. SID5785]
MSAPATVLDKPAVQFADDDFAPLDVRVVVAAHPIGRLMCSTSDGCGNTCGGNASSCSSLVRDPE